MLRQMTLGRGPFCPRENTDCKDRFQNNDNSFSPSATHRDRSRGRGWENTICEQEAVCQDPLQPLQRSLPRWGKEAMLWAPRVPGPRRLRHVHAHSAVGITGLIWAPVHSLAPTDQRVRLTQPCPCFTAIPA